MTTRSALVAAAILVVIALVVGAGLLDDLVRVVVWESLAVLGLLAWYSISRRRR